MINVVNPLSNVYSFISDFISLIPPFIMHLFYLFVLMYVVVIVIKTLRS